MVLEVGIVVLADWKLLNQEFVRWDFDASPLTAAIINNIPFPCIPDFLVELFTPWCSN